MKCSKCGGEMVKVCDPVSKKCYWVCMACGHEK
jgi:hypothetical protein